MTRVGLGTIHHEGAGDPGHLERIAHAGYTYGVAGTTVKRYRSVAESFATAHFNHVSVDVCLSGDRRYHPVTDTEVRSIRQCFADARGRGEVIANPQIRPHAWTPDNSTICPAHFTLLRINEITAVCQGTVPAPQPPHPNHPTLAPGSTGPAVALLQHELNVGTGQHLAQDGIFGAHTLLAVHAFQAFFHLDVDGIVGPKTWAVLDYCYALHGGH